MSAMSVSIARSVMSVSGCDVVSLQISTDAPIWMETTSEYTEFGGLNGLSGN